VCIAIAVLAGACVSSQETFTQKGKKGYVVNCTPSWTHGLVGNIANAQTSWGTCYQKAGEICGAHGFDVLERVGEGQHSTIVRGMANRNFAQTPQLIAR
jgi:hypothetical protein